jgi:uncharacterized protein (TIGR02466 family)
MAIENQSQVPDQLSPTGSAQLQSQHHMPTPGLEGKKSSLDVAQFSYFPSLLFRFDLTEADRLNEQLLSLIHAWRNVDKKGVEKSNYRFLGGWHSRENLHKMPGFEDIAGYIHQAGERISSELQYHNAYALRITSMWSIINPPGASNLAHIHPGSSWSGVYYVQAPEGCGSISFTDPRTANVMNRPRYMQNRRGPKSCWTKVRFSPVAGRMLVFPSWLYHSVDPNRANHADGDRHNGDRVIISFNLSQFKK